MQEITHSYVRRNGIHVRYVGLSEHIAGYTMEAGGWACCAFEGCDVSGLRCRHTMAYLVPFGYQDRGDTAIFRVSREGLMPGYHEKPQNRDR